MYIIHGLEVFAELTMPKNFFSIQDGVAALIQFQGGSPALASQFEHTGQSMPYSGNGSSPFQHELSLRSCELFPTRSTAALDHGPSSPCGAVPGQPCTRKIVPGGISTPKLEPFHKNGSNASQKRRILPSWGLMRQPPHLFCFFITLGEELRDAQ